MTIGAIRAGVVVLLCAGAMAVVGPALADDCQWAEGTAKVAADTLTPAEAKQIALRQARATAIATAVGVEVRAETVTRDFVMVTDFVRTLVQGYVKRERILEWAQESYQLVPTDSPIPITRVTLRVCVVPVKRKQDAGFRVKATINKPVFSAGERARVEVTATRPAHVTIFNLLEDDRIQVYGEAAMGFPLRVGPDAPVPFPPPGVSLTMELPPNQTRASEAFIVVATKAEEDIALPLAPDMTHTLSLAEFYGGLAEIQTYIADTIVPYLIVGR